MAGFAAALVIWGSALLVSRLLARDWLSPLSVSMWLVCVYVGFRAALIGLDPAQLHPRTESWEAFDELVFLAACLTVGWLAALAFGFVVSQRVGRVAVSVNVLRLSRSSESALARSSVLLSTICVLQFLYVGRQVGFGSTIAGVRAGSPFGSLNFVEAFPEMSAVYCALAYVALTDSSSARFERRVVLISVLVSSAVALLFGDRSAAILPFLLMAFGSLSIRKDRSHSAARQGRSRWSPVVRFALLGCIVLVGAVAAASLADLRNSQFQAFESGEAPGQVERIVDAINSNNFDHTLLVLRDLDEEVSRGNGAHLVGGAVGVVPRAIWPSKPPNELGLSVRQAYIPGSTTGWPLAAWGEWYYEFGFLGVFLGGMVGGAVFSGLERKLRAQGSAQRRIATAYGIALVMLAFPYGYAMGSPMRLVLLAGTVTIGARIAERLSPPRPAGPVSPVGARL